MTASMDRPYESYARPDATTSMAGTAIERDTQTVREAVGVFTDIPSLEAAVDELLMDGFDRAHLSLIATERTIEEKLRHRYERPVTEADRLMDGKSPGMAYVDSDSVNEAKAGLAGGLAYLGAMVAAGTVVFSGGAAGLAVLAAVAAGGGGAAIGTLLGRFIGKGYADALQNQLERGGILLWVACQDVTHEEKAMNILRRHGAADVHVHELPTPDPALYTPGGVSYDVSFMNRIGL